MISATQWVAEYPKRIPYFWAKREVGFISLFIVVVFFYLFDDVLTGKLDKKKTVRRVLWQRLCPAIGKHLSVTPGNSIGIRTERSSILLMLQKYPCKVKFWYFSSDDQKMCFFRPNTYAHTFSPFLALNFFVLHKTRSSHCTPYILWVERGAPKQEFLAFLLTNLHWSMAQYSGHC